MCLLSDVDECHDSLDNCDDRTVICRNTIGSFVCDLCPRGFMSNEANEECIGKIINPLLVIHGMLALFLVCAITDFCKEKVKRSLK